MTALPAPPLLVLTDRAQASRPLTDIAAEIFAAGAPWLVLREKDLPREALGDLAGALKAQAEAYGSRLSLAGTAEQAKSFGLTAVHLPRDGDPAAARRLLGEAALIGLSAHDRAEAERAAAAGADYVTLSPIFESPSKPGYGPALGLTGLTEITEGLPIPVLALGGVSSESVAALVRAGAGGVAVMGAVMAAAEPGRAIAALLEAFAIAGQAERQTTELLGATKAEGAG